MFGFVCPHSLMCAPHWEELVVYTLRDTYVLEAGLLLSAFAGRRIVFPSTSGGSRSISTTHMF